MALQHRISADFNGIIFLWPFARACLPAVLFLPLHLYYMFSLQDAIDSAIGSRRHPCCVCLCRCQVIITSCDAIQPVVNACSYSVFSTFNMLHGEYPALQTG